MTARLMISALTLMSLVGTASAAGSLGNGGALYDQHCASCHGFDGVPNLPGTPDFTRGETLLKSDAELIRSIRYGITSMPGFDQIIDKEGLLDVVFYMRSLQR